MTQATAAVGTGALPDAASIGRAIRKRREALRVTQASLAQEAGFSVQQTLSEIENGRREVKAHELMRIARALHTEMDVLLGIEPERVEHRVLWRRGARPEDRSREAQLLERCRRYAQLEEWCGEEPAQALPNYQFDPASASDDLVSDLTEQTRRALELGSIPAATLERTLEDTYGVKIFVEILEGDQAAACVRSDLGAAVLLNGADVPWRRNFSLAHEVFHLVTWEAVERAWTRGPRGDDDEPAWYNGVERWANQFAAQLLLPGDAVRTRLRPYVEHGQITFEQLVSVARDFEVSAEAFVYRLRDLNIIGRDRVEKTLYDAEFQRVKREVMRHLRDERVRMSSAWYPERYMKLAMRAFQRGVIGKSVVAKYLELPYAEVETMDLGQPHGSEAAVSLA
jgi:Zn-dependent peptidase ImmA (M78 family)/transcriptional regulator with XRE-family HTH domain